ncbi:MAG: PQQ-like beta-propeller repeat protein [Stenomitos rutilans HA7619-LM2]|jgi:polyvinyl alcohol dehydrogenase (cytochrome)|nr:PQQ-like beta-propeller repeat protein [Stenomitos rutilans HA7619-LM2]
MRVWKLSWWKVALLGSTIALLGWVSWRYADQRRPTLVALNTQTGKLQWVHALTADAGYSKGPIAGDGKVLLGFCRETAEQRCGAYQLQAFDAQSGKLLWSDRPAGRYDPYEIASNQSALLQDNQLYLQLEEELRSLDPATGKQRWAIPRRWFFAPAGVWHGMGFISHSDAVAIINLDGKQQQLQTLDPKTGKLLQQTKRSFDKLTATQNLIAANDRTLFLETSGLVPADVPNTFFDSGTSIVTAYDRKTLKPRFRTTIQGNISHLQVAGETLQIRTASQYDGQKQTIVTGKVLAVSTTSGQILWQKNRAQLGCREDGYSWRVDADTVYLNCDRNGRVRYKSQESKIVALPAQTGQVKWQTQISPDRYSYNLPNAVSAQQYFTFRLVGTADKRQTQAIALDRQTGKLLWAFSLFDPEAKYVDTFQSVVAAEGDRFFFLDSLSRWQLWLLQINRNWYLKQPLSVSS